MKSRIRNSTDPWIFGRIQRFWFGNFKRPESVPWWSTGYLGMPTGPIGSLLMLGSDLRAHIIDDFVWARMLSQTKIHVCSNVEIASEMASVDDCGWLGFRDGQQKHQKAIVLC